jgi:hypothetical protein
LERLQSLGVTVRADGDALRVKPASLVPPALMAELRQNKAEVLALLASPQRPRVVDATPQWHAEQVARRVEAEGVCVFWSELFGGLVAFVKDDSYKRHVPREVVTYTCTELRELDKAAPLDAALLSRVHQAKKLSGGTVISNEPE